LQATIVRVQFMSCVVTCAWIFEKQSIIKILSRNRNNGIYRTSSFFARRGLYSMELCRWKQRR